MTTIYFLFWVDAVTGNPSFSGPAEAGPDGGDHTMHNKMRFAQRGKTKRKPRGCG